LQQVLFLAALVGDADAEVEDHHVGYRVGAVGGEDVLAELRGVTARLAAEDAVEEREEHGRQHDREHAEGWRPEPAEELGSRLRPEHLRDGREFESRKCGAHATVSFSACLVRSRKASSRSAPTTWRSRMSYSRRNSSLSRASGALLSRRT